MTGKDTGDFMAFRGVRDPGKPDDRLRKTLLGADSSIRDALVPGARNLC